MNALRRGRVVMVAGAVVALLCASCGRSRELSRYRGTAFDAGKPRTPGWTLIADPEYFAQTPPRSLPGVPDVAQAKVVELRNPRHGALVEVFLVDGGAADAERVMQALIRRRQRRAMTQGESRLTTVGGRRGLARIAAWRPAPGVPVRYLYCVRVPLGSKLWCFVGCVGKAQFDAARDDFRAILNSVRFHG